MNEPTWIDRELEHAHRELVERSHRERRAEELRGEVCWHMAVADLLTGHGVLGFDYPVSGDRRPTIRA